MKGHPNRVLAIVVGVVALVAVAAVVVSATRSAPEYAPGTPERTVQDYLSAVVDGDAEAAVELLAEDTSCDLEDFDRAFVPDGIRVVLRDTDVDGDRALVEVEVVFADEGALGGPEYAERQNFRLSRTGDRWLIEGAPWPLFECDRGD